MKKFLFIMLCMMLALGKAYAQEQSVGQGMPIEGKTKFANRHHIYQTLEISTIAGKDKDLDGDDSDDAGSRTDGLVDPPDLISNLNAGMNIGYSMVFVPGEIRDNQLFINRFGFAYSVGFIAAFDQQDQYDVTCDFLGKIGIETGNGHNVGIGVDLLLGGGKTANTTYCWLGEEWDQIHGTVWCYKKGLQVWLRTNLIATSFSNTDVVVFGRFVKSSTPDGVDEFEDSCFDVYMEESWQFGLTFKYTF